MYTPSFEKDWTWTLETATRVCERGKVETTFSISMHHANASASDYGEKMFVHVVKMFYFQ